MDAVHDAPEKAFETGACVDPLQDPDINIDSLSCDVLYKLFVTCSWLSSFQIVSDDNCANFLGIIFAQRPGCFGALALS